MTIFLPTSITFDLESSNLEKKIEGVTFEDKNHEIKYIYRCYKRRPTTKYQNWTWKVWTYHWWISNIIGDISFETINQLCMWRNLSTKHKKLIIQKKLIYIYIKIQQWMSCDSNEIKK